MIGLFNRQRAAQLLGCNAFTITRRINAKDPKERLNCIRIKNRVWFTMAHIEEFVSRNDSMKKGSKKK